MGKLWINNNIDDRLAMIQKAELAHVGMNQTTIEKDWWVMAVLKALFMTDCAPYLLFKGGTSLSKGFGLIERFSEDIDLAISHSFFGIEKTNKSQREKLRKMSREYVHGTLSVQLDHKLRELGVTGYTISNVTHVEGKNGELHPIDSDKDPTVIMLNYESIVGEEISYIPSRVKIEVSCLSMDVPTEDRSIQSMIEDTFSGEDSGIAGTFKTVLPTRTFLEKIFLLAEEFQKEKPRSVRMTRHLYDLERLMDTQYGVDALSDSNLYHAIVGHRRSYYALKYVNYDSLNPSEISFVPPLSLHDEWRADYDDMKQYFIYGYAPSFDELISRIVILQERVRRIV